MTLITAEFVLLFVLIPAAYALRMIPLPFVPILIVIALYGWSRLRADPTLDRRALGWGGADRAAVMRVLLFAIPVTATLVALVWWFRPERLFYLPRHRAGLWLVIMILYPVLSVYPQEIIYRAFFLHRYRALLPDDRVRLWLGAALFGIHHAILGNVWAVILSFLGGLKFAHTYTRNRSLLLASLEHALYGCILFTVGLGEYFYDASRGTSVYRWFH